MSEFELSENFKWNVIKSYFEKKGFIDHQITTFNDYINTGIQRVVKECDIIVNQKDLKYTVNFGEVYIPTPKIIEEDRKVRLLYPLEARTKDLNYDSPIFVDIKETIEIDGQKPEINLHERIKIGRTPIMLRSEKCNLSSCSKKERILNGECEWDSGGYFIIKGKERVLVGQLRGIYNQPLVLAQKSGEKYKYICDVRSMSEETGHSVLLQVKIGSDDRNIVFSLPYIKEVIPVGIVFKALGYLEDEEIADIIGDNENKDIQRYIRYIIRDSYFIKTQEEALRHIGQFSMHIIKEEKRKDYALQVVENELLPHMGITSTIKEKVYFLGNMVNKLLKTSIGLRTEDDRDNYSNKRVEMAGVLCCELFRTLFKRFTKNIEIQLERKKQRPDVLSIISRNTSITLGLKHAFACGSWGVQKNNYIRTGVSQVLSRMTFSASLSHLRRIIIPIGKEGKNTKIRQTHSSQIMYVCNSECFDPETPILLWNGNIKLAKDIIVGDLLIDDNGNPTRVKSTCSGMTTMYDIQQEKRNFMNYTVTDNHILTLKIRKYKSLSKKRGKYTVNWFDKELIKYKYKTNFDNLEDAQKFHDSIPNDDVLDITIEKYLKLSKNIKKILVGFKSNGVNWNRKDIELDPYILGMWLGDGDSCGKGFSTEDIELLNYWKDWAKDNNSVVTLVPRKLTEDKNYTYKEHQISDSNEYRPDIAYSVGVLLKHKLAKYNLVNNKHIPVEYLTNDRETRLKVLAGLIDTDGNVRANGHEIRICQGPKNSKIVHDALFLAQSLGFSCHLNNGKSQWTYVYPDGKKEKRFSTYEELTITGEFLYEIPTLLPRKKLNDFSHNEIARKRCSSFMQSEINVIKKDFAPFVGWQLEGNGRFLLADFTTVHNTPEGQSVGIVLNLALSTTVTRRIPTVVVKEIIENCDNFVFLNNFNGKNDKPKIFLNGILMGITLDLEEFMKELKRYRKNGLLDKDISFTYNKIDNEIKIFSDEGRFIRPIFTLNEEGKLNINEKIDSPDWDELLEKQYVQYIDNSEIENSVVAMDEKDLVKYKNDFCEICPAMMMGVVASLIPFPEHCPSARNIFQSNMGQLAQVVSKVLLVYNII